MARPTVPKFGNWESEENVPYTAYFDKARKGRSGGKMINPNDPQENPDMFPNIVPPAQAPPSRSRAEPEEPSGGRGAVRPTHEREDGDFRQFKESPARNDNVGRRAANETLHQRHGGRGSGSGRPVRSSAGSEHSIDRSPLHPHYQARSRMKPVAREDESDDKGAQVPRFGEWDENNPASADNYTHIFNKVREEKQTGSANVSGMDIAPPYHNTRNQSADDNYKNCCFPWSKK